ncbi:hypothetical protein ACJX0J_008656, partial [Zea mays]
MKCLDAMGKGNTLCLIYRGQLQDMYDYLVDDSYMRFAILMHVTPQLKKHNINTTKTSRKCSADPKNAKTILLLDFFVNSLSDSSLIKSSAYKKDGTNFARRLIGFFQNKNKNWKNNKSSNQDDIFVVAFKPQAT